VTLSAQTGIGSGDALETTIVELSAVNRGSGDIRIAESDGVNLKQLLQDSVTSTDGIYVVSATGSLRVFAGGTGVEVKGSGEIDLFADGGDLGNLVVDAAVKSLAGSVTLGADNNVTFGAGGDVSSTSGSIAVSGDFDVSGTPVTPGGFVQMSDGALIESVTGTISVSAAGTVTVDQHTVRS
jgi:hypothetical protein